MRNTSRRMHPFKKAMWKYTILLGLALGFIHWNPTGNPHVTALQYAFGQASPEKLDTALTPSINEDYRKDAARNLGLPPGATWVEIHRALQNRHSSDYHEPHFRSI